MDVIKIPKKTVTIIEPKRSMVVDKEKYRQKRVAAYCRVSTDSEEQINSYNNQKKNYSEMIASNKDWFFVGLYADEGISGTRADKRPEFNRLIKDCFDGKIDLVITKSVSRFARNTVECLDFVRKLKARGIGIFFEEQNIDTLKVDSELYLIIYAGFAQSESESMSKNITWAWRKNFENGIPAFQYKTWLGYQKGADGKPEIVPEEAEIVKRIFSMYLSGATQKQISQQLIAEHTEVPGKKFKFTSSMVWGVLTNERYTGDCILQKTVTVDCIEKRRKKNTGEAPMYMVHNNHAPIISREMFNRVQVEMARRQTLSPKSLKSAITATGKYSKYALSEVMTCGECGTRYKRVTWSRNRVKRVVWRCISRLDYGTKYCHHSPTVFEEPLKQAIVRAINRFHADDEHTYLALMNATIADAIGLNGGSDEADLLERRIDALNNKMLNIVNQSVQNGDDMEQHEDEFREITQEIDQLKERIKSIQEAALGEDERKARLELIQNTIAERNRKALEYDDSIVRQMIECIRVHEGGKITIIFGGGYEVEEQVQDVKAN